MNRSSVGALSKLIACVAIAYLVWSVYTWTVMHSVELRSGRCADQLKPREELQVDVPKRDKTPMCLTGVSDIKQLRWSDDGKVLGYSVLALDYSSLIYLIDENSSDMRQVYNLENQVGSSWYLSPDGQYLVTSSSSPSFGSSGTILNVDTGEAVCSYRNAPSSSLNQEIGCKLLPLRDGRWWSVTTGLILKQHNVLVENHRGLAIRSPNQKWILMGDDSRWLLTNQDITMQREIVFPHVDELLPCGASIQAEWSANSKQFAILYTHGHRTFVWDVADNGEIVLTTNIESDCTTTFDFFNTDSSLR